MSDFQQDPGATQVMPPAPPSAPPGAPAGGQPPEEKRGMPWWMVLLIALFVGIAAAAAVWAVFAFRGDGTDPELAQLKEQNEELSRRVDDLSGQLASATAEQDDAQETEPEVTETGPANDEPTAATSEDGKQFTFVKKVVYDGGTAKLTLDYAQFLTGAQAAAAAAAHGDESPPPNDYYIVNDNPKLRVYPVKPGITVTVYGFGSGDSSAKSTISFGQWFDLMPGGTATAPPWDKAPYWITLSGGQIVKIEQQYLP